MNSNHKILKKTEFGNPILRLDAQQIDPDEILAKKIQELIDNMLYSVEQKKYGVGLAAPQVGVSLALSVILIKPTPTRPDLREEKLVIINPEIIKTYGYRSGMWEGCISGPNLYGKAMRYKKVRLRYYDERGIQHERDFAGFIAHVIQHEVDHLNGELFVDKVRDTKTYMTFTEYIRMKKKKK